MSKIRLAVVGAGNQCTTALMPGIPYIEEIDLVAICDLNRALAERNARNFGGGAVYTDVTQMLEQEKPNACMVVGPPQVHEEVGLQVLEAGVNLFIEKPAAPTIEGAKRLADAAAKNGVMGQVGHMMRHSDPIRIAHEISHSEEFGEILSVESKYVTWPTGPAGAGWGGADEDWSYMLIQGCHPIDLIRHFLGEIVSVAAFRKHGTGKTKVFQVSLEGGDGRVGFLNLQDSYNGWYTGLEIMGDGKAVVRVDDLGRVSYRKGEKRTTAEKEPWGHSAYVWEPHHMLTHWRRAGYGNQLKSFARSILDNTPTYPSLRDGWRNLVVARAILDSCATRSVVEVPQD